MAKSPRFINFSELSDELRHFIEAGAKIFPIDTFESLPNEKTYEFYRVLSGDHKNEIYGWSEIDSKYVLIGADDRDIRWDDVQYKPTEFTPINHNHTLLEIIDFPSNMPPSNHTHTENEITDLDKYTKLEIDGALSGKANSVHSHFESDIVDLDKYTKAEIDDALSGKVDKVDGKGLSTNDFTTSDKNKLDSLSENASLDYTSMQEALNNHKTSSDHDGRYYTKTDLDTILSGKADKTVVNGHINSSTIHVTQDDKDTWNTVSNKVDNSRVLTDVPANAKFTDTITTINGNTGAITKADIVALGIPAQDTVYTHPSTHPASMITETSGKRFVSDDEKTTWNSKADGVHTHNEYLSKTNTTAFTPTGDYHPATKKYVDDAMSDAGQGDMLKAVYDTNNNGKVDVAELADSVPWSGVTGKPTAFTPNTHSHTKSQISDMPTSLSQFTKDINFDERYYTESEVDVKLGDKVDKITGKNLSTNDFTDVLKSKLDGIAVGANNYTHPSTHPPSIIAQDSNNRFVTDVEKNNWNGKADVSDIPTSLSQLTNDSGFITINQVPQGIEVVQNTPTTTKSGQIIFLEVI